ncbi:hypothetical protein ACFXKW_24915 [Streptomyces sp. NPDC059193]|uniref:hypothetical protein n=1 Tax=Streptomyces sp. NPDC059193 TaxID=3346763 RepID=UPI003697CDD5
MHGLGGEDPAAVAGGCQGRGEAGCAGGAAAVEDGTRGGPDGCAGEGAGAEAGAVAEPVGPGCGLSPDFPPGPQPVRTSSPASAPLNAPAIAGTRR